MTAAEHGEGHAPDEWRLGEIPARCQRPGGEVLTLTLAGWTNGLFGLDFRVYDDEDGDPFIPGWSVTHIPTGFTVCAILTNLDRAKDLVEELAQAADWNFSDAGGAKERGPAFQAFKDQHWDEVLRGTARFAPMSLETKALSRADAVKEVGRG